MQGRFEKFAIACFVIALLSTLLFVLATALGPLSFSVCILARFINSAPASKSFRKSASSPQASSSFAVCEENFKELRTLEESHERQNFQLQELDDILSTSDQSSPPRAIAALFYMDDLESCEEDVNLKVVVIEPVKWAASKEAESSFDANDADNDATAEIGGAILSFFYFFNYPCTASRVSTECALPLVSASFDLHIDFQVWLRLFLMGIVFHMRYGQSFKKSSTRLLCMVSLLSMQYYASERFMPLFVGSLVYNEMFQLPPFVISIISSFSASVVMFFVYVLCFPYALSFFKFCLDSFPKIEGGPTVYEFSWRNMSRVMEIRENRRNNPNTNDCAMSVGHYTTEYILKYCAYFGLDSLYNCRKMRMRFFKIFKWIRVFVNVAGVLLSALAFFGSIPELQAACAESLLCKETVNSARLWLSRDVIVNVGTIAASYLHPLTIFPKVFTRAFTVLAVSLFWFRPLFFWINPLYSKVNNISSAFTRFCTSLHIFIKKFIFEPFVKVPKFFQKNAPEFLAKIKKLLNLFKIDPLEPNKIDKIDQQMESFQAKIQQNIQHPKFQRLFTGIKVLLAIIIPATFVLYLIEKSPWHVLEVEN
jgi:hypothetical protein